MGGGWGGWSKLRPYLFVPGNDPVPIVKEAGWVLGPVWTGAENLATPPGFDARTIQPLASLYTEVMYVFSFQNLIQRSLSALTGKVSKYF